MYEVDLSDQRLLSLPQEARRPQIEILIMSGNFLTSLPSGFSSTWLKVLDLSRNRLSEKFRLQTLFENLPNLEIVNLSENEIRASPGNLSHARLKQLSLARNRLGVLQAARWELPDLEILSLEETELMDIETGSTWEFSGSCRVNLSSNNFQVIPELPLLSEISHVDLSQNERILVANVSALKHCVSADLADCRITNFQGRIPPSLTALNLANNQLQSTTALPGGFDSLREVDLRGNDGFMGKISFFIFPTLRVLNGQRRFDRLVDTFEDVSESTWSKRPDLEISTEPWDDVSRQVVINPLTKDISIKLTKSPVETPKETPKETAKETAKSPTVKLVLRPESPAVMSKETRQKVFTSPTHESVTALLRSNEVGERNLDAKVKELVKLRKSKMNIHLDDSDDLPMTPRQKVEETEFLPLRTLMLRRPMKVDDREGTIIPVEKQSPDFVRLREMVGDGWRLVRAVRSFNRRRVEGLEGKLTRLQISSPLGRVETLFAVGENLSEILIDGFQNSPVILKFSISREPPGTRMRALVCGFIPGKTFETPLSLREALKGVLPWSQIFRKGFDSVYFPREHAYAVLHGPSSRLLPAYLIEVERNSTDQT